MTIQKKIFLLMFVFIGVLFGSSLYQKPNALFAQSNAEASTSNVPANEENEFPNIPGLHSIQLPEEGLSDEEKTTLDELKLIVDTMIKSSTLNEMIENCNNTPHPIFGIEGRYFTMSILNNSSRNGTHPRFKNASVVLYNNIGQIVVKHYVSETNDGVLYLAQLEKSFNEKGYLDESTDLAKFAPKRPVIHEEARLIILEKVVTGGFEPLPEQLSEENEEQYNKGDIISISVLRYSPAEETTFYFHPNGMLYALSYGKSNDAKENWRVRPRPYSLFAKGDLVNKFTKWESNGKLFKNYKLDKPVRLPYLQFGTDD